MEENQNPGSLSLGVSTMQLFIATSYSNLNEVHNAETIDYAINYTTRYQIVQSHNKYADPTT